MATVPQKQTKSIGLQSQTSASPEEIHIESEPSGVPVCQTPLSRRHLSRNRTVDNNDAGALNDRREDEKDRYVGQATSFPSSSSASSAKISCPGSPIGFSNTDHVSASSNLPRYSYMPPLSPRCTTQPSPRIHSPASSLIFERDVQEDILPAQTSPSIPSHIRTENHIPPVLEASSVAIADDQLDPDSVEIITHSVHQPAATGVTSNTPTEQPLSSSWLEEVRLSPNDSQELFATQGALDTAHVRRLSFVSFADVVNAEHVETSEPLPNGDTLASHNRLPSPMRSSTSSHGFGTSPPTSISTSFKGLDASPNRGGCKTGSPLATAQSPHSPNSRFIFGSELNVETMRQALRRTGSGDLNGVRSQVSSSTMGNDDFPDYPI